MRYLYYVLYSVLVISVTSCKRVIDVKLDNAMQMIVIEGNLNNIQGQQIVTLTKSVPYNDANVYPAVTGAKVTITGNNTVYTLRENKPGQYIATLRGRSGQKYTLNVTDGESTYTAVSTMPNNVTLDSLGVSAIEVGKKTVKTISAFYKDPGTETNQYRFLIFVNGIQVKDVFTASDYLTNGRYINTTLYQDDITLKTGDKVDVELQCIDNNIYNYFYSLSQQGGNSPNNSATPSNPTSNFNNGALGYFSAYTTQRKSITVL